VIELFPYKVNRPLFANIIDKVRSHSNANAQACNVHHATYKCFFPVRAEQSIDSQVMVASEEFHSESNQTYKVRYYQWQNRHFHPPPPAPDYPEFYSTPAHFRVRLSLTTDRISPTAAAYTPGWSRIRSVVVR
jgi:hypothetical protein